jgi:5-methylcytosine-specific restriction enzyme subunit McrC
LLSEEAKYRQSQPTDEQQLSSLYEQFVRAFYKKETTYQVSSPYIRWNVDDGYSEDLPLMKTDVVLKEKQQTLIIDTKFYAENMVASYRSHTLKHQSDNLYQLYSYVMNYLLKKDETVGGMLLYAKTKAFTQPNHEYVMNGKHLWIMALDLDQPFEEIKAQLLALPRRYFCPQ